MKTFALKGKGANPRKVTFLRTHATLSQWCGVCKNWTCMGKDRASKVAVKKALDEAKRGQAQIGCQSFSTRTAAVRYARTWVGAK